MNLETLLHHIIPNPSLHCRWLNTLSFLENCGARKIAKYEHSTLVKTEMLKHAAEEFRHAHYLKKQLKKISSNPPENYALSNLLGGWNTLHYLDRLEIEISRYYKKNCYEIVTYAIEKRAESVYPLYQKILKHYNSRIHVKSIILEEAEHLSEMARLVKNPRHKAHALSLEHSLFKKWLNAIYI